MAGYKYSNHLNKVDGDIFDATHKPGEVCPYSGIYICTACSDEAACNKGDPLPPQNHRQHDPKLGLIRWKLLVIAQHVR
jgi:hypothetical protein